MFELSIALKYLIPKRGSLSSAFISIMAVVVISLVIWLVLVFLSVTSGIEKNWLARLTALHAPIRISPTPEYYNSYFYQIDSLSSSSQYTYKTIGEKKTEGSFDPFSADVDPEIPFYFPQKEISADGSFLNPVQTMFEILEEIKKEENSSVCFQDYEISSALMRLFLKKGSSTLSQMSYLLSIPDQNPHLHALFIPPQEGPLDFDAPPEKPPAYAHFVQGKLQLPQWEDAICAILPKAFQDGGASIGDRGTLSYSSFSPVSIQEHKILFRVAGFYDPGVMAVGNKCLLIPGQATRDIYTATQTFSPDGTPTNGIFVWLNQLEKTPLYAQKISEKIASRNISSYWKLDTYENFEFAKDLLQQFRSDRMLLLLIAAIILIVACCNIISLLVLLVSDKKKEIAILQSMGASFQSIALIFGGCGAILGIVSCLFGSMLAVLTLHNLDALISFLSMVQGRSAFHPAFFGQSLPNALSLEAVAFVCIATPLLSFIAGLIPAIKASKIKPAMILRGDA